MEPIRPEKDTRKNGGGDEKENLSFKQMNNSTELDEYNTYIYISAQVFFTAQIDLKV